MADASLYYFCKYILGFRDMEVQPHWKVCNFVQKWGLRDDILVLLPRGTFKSSLITVGYVLWRLTKNRDLRVLITSQKLANAKNWLGLITKHIETNQLFRRLYGCWDKDKHTRTWHSTAISLYGRKRFTAENSITASSPETSKVSQHYDWVVGDDLQTDENVTSKEMIDAVAEYIELLLPILDPQPELGGQRGRRTFVGTRWHFDDIYGRMRAREKKYRRNTSKQSLRILNEKAAEMVKLKGDKFELGGQLFFPSRFSKEYLEEIQETMSLYQFSCNYLNDPMPEGAAVFKVSKLGFFNDRGRIIEGKVSDMPPILHKFCTIDPSLGEHADSDYTAMVIAGVDAEWNIYILDILRAHIDPEEIIDHMFRIHSEHSIVRMGVETVSFQKALLYGFKQKCREKGVWFRVMELRTDSTISKELRIRGFEPFVTAGKVYFRVEDKSPLTSDREDLYYAVLGNQAILLDEMQRFPLGETKDCIDALAYLPQVMFPAGVQVEKPEPSKGSLGEIRRRLKRSKTKGGLLSEVR